MSSAKRTPRYVDVIRPFELVEPKSSAEVIRLRPEYGPKLPPVTQAWPRVKAVPVARRPWQLLLVPPTPGAPTRSFNVARWQARLLLIAASAVLVVAGAGATAFVVALRSPDLFAGGTEAASLRSRLTIVEDSLALARAELENPDDSLAVVAATASADASTSVAAPRAPARVAAPVVKASARRTPSAALATRAADDGGSAFDGLPVIGAIASRFSRARWHPLLHVTRPHLGVDVAARRGTKITAPAPGRVTFVGRKFGFGLVLEIQHSNGVTTRYAHCGSALIAEGAHVERGTPIATVGTSGLSTGPHLHYEVLVHGHQVDPLRFRMPQMGDSVPAPHVALTPSTAAQPSAGPAAPVVATPVAPAPLAPAPTVAHPTQAGSPK
jgi:murein DD-endopeptidase MepM/ murein hydrolase activator NlpD